MSKIEYESLEFKNAYIYRHCIVPLQDQGLVLIRGLNLDDGGYLGAGKSSMFEMFAQLQMGKGGKRDLRKGQHRYDMINRSVGSNLEASLRLRVDDHPYELRQYRNHDHYGNATFAIDLETGVNLIPRECANSPFKWIRDTLLKTDETTFFNLVYMAQESNNIMISGTESARRQQLTSMFGLDVYDDLYTATRRQLDVQSTAVTDLDNLAAELSEIEQRLLTLPAIDVVQQQLDKATTTFTDLKESVAAKMQEFTELSNLQACLKQRNDLISEVKAAFLKSKFPELIKTPNDITEQYINEQGIVYENAYAAYVMTKNSLEGVQRHVILTAQLQNIRGRDQDVVNNELVDVKSKIRVLQLELPQAEERIEILSEMQRLGAAVLTIDSVDEQYSVAVVQEVDLKNRINVVHTQLSSEVCPTCHRPYHITAVDVKRLQSELLDLRDALEAVVKVLHGLKAAKIHIAKYKSFQDRLSVIAVLRTPEEIQIDISKLSKLERVLATEFELSKQRLSILGQLAELPEGDVESLSDKVKELKKSYELAQLRHVGAKTIMAGLLKLLKLKKGDLAAVEFSITRVKVILDRASASMARASKKVSDLSTVVDEIKRLATRQDKLHGVLDKRADLLAEVMCLEALKKAFDPKGIKQERFRSILIDATIKTVPMYSRLLWPSGNIDLRIDDQESSIHFDLFRSNTQSAVNYTLLSGGERHKAGLAFLFGMRDLKELYTGTYFNVLVVDEPFGGLDPQGTESLISIFETLKHRFGTIFVISHRPEVLEHTVWDKTWWAIREHDNATLYTDGVPARYLRIARELVKQ